MAGHEDYSDNRLLNDQVAGTLHDQYTRILQYRNTKAVAELTQKLVGLMETIQRVGQLMHDKIDQLRGDARTAARAQAWQQGVLIMLTLVIAGSTAAYTWITWEAVRAQREGNEIQQKLLDLQRRAAPR
jgi:hypothetical protein